MGLLESSPPCDRRKVPRNVPLACCRALGGKAMENPWRKPSGLEPRKLAFREKLRRRKILPVRPDVLDDEVAEALGAQPKRPSPPQHQAQLAFHCRRYELTGC